MQFPFVDISYVFDEIRSLLKTMNVKGLINDDDCRSSAFSAIRLIGCNNYQDKHVFVEIKNFNGFIPKDFYLIKDIKYVGNTPESNFSEILKSGDSNTQKYFFEPSSFSAANNLHSFTHSFTIKIPPGIIRTSIQNGFISLTYFQIPNGEDGSIMVQDEENTIQAIKFYIIRDMLYEKYLLGEVDKTAFQNIEAKYERYLNEAQQVLKFPDPSSAEYMVKMTNHRYDQFKLNRP